MQKESSLEYYSGSYLLVCLEGKKKIFDNKASEESEAFETAKWKLCSWLAASKEFRESSDAKHWTRLIYLLFYLLMYFFIYLRVFCFFLHLQVF